MNERMRQAYQAAQKIAESDLQGDERTLLEGLGEEDVVIVRGSYDRVEEVLGLARIPHRVIDPRQVGSEPLRPEQLLIINCPGNLDRPGLTAVRTFVERGGSLITTDWALKHVLEQAFPGFVAYNEHPTADEVVRIEIRNSDDPFLRGLFHEGADPLWWLEGSSYPIRILDPDRVQVLLTSREIADKYGEAPVAVMFNVGEGDVLHMISHYYLQRAETRTQRHALKGAAYAVELGLSDLAVESAAEFDAVSLAEVEAAHKSLRFTRNIILEKQRRNRRRGGDAES